jgi:hypothetical protein
MTAINKLYYWTKVVPEAEPWIFYTDVRAWQGIRRFYAKAREHLTIL